MSQSELEALRAKEAELRAALKAAEERRAQLEREAEEEEREYQRMLAARKPIEVHVRALVGGSVQVEGGVRDDVLDIWRNTPGRSFQGTFDGRGRNLIPTGQWAAVLAKLSALPGVTVTWEVGVREEIEWWLNAPPWEVILHPSRRFFIVKMGPRQHAFQILSNVPGGDWDWSSKSWKLPLSEGWRIFRTLEKIDGVVYSNDAQQAIFEQVSQRNRLDLIARKEDSEVLKEGLNGHQFLPAQRVGVEFMLEAGARVLLADPTGCGKTWEFLGVCEVLRRMKPDMQAIIGVKAANLPNWKREIPKLTGIEPIVCEGGKPEYFTIDSIVNKRHPYVLISHDTLAAHQTIEDEGKEIEVYPWVGVFKAANPDIYGIDEAHQCKNPDTYRSKAMRQLATVPRVIPMTASPVLNRTEELWPLLFMVDPEMFKVHEHFLNTYTFDGKIPRNVEQLQELMRPRFLQRERKAFQKDLPPIHRMVRYHDLSKRASELYDLVLQGIYEQLAEFDPGGQGGVQMHVMSILARIMRLKQICAADKVEYTSDLAQSIADENPDGGKVLVFSQFKGTALSIAQRLGNDAVCTVTRTRSGFTSMNAQQRDDLFEAARYDPAVRYLVTTEAAKEGHNLEFCDWVIFNDPFWTPAGHDQCEGRAYGRLSNPHSIDSYYIVADVDIERWIMELLEKKLNIIQQSVGSIEASRDANISIGMELIKKIKESMYRRAA